MLRRRLAIPLAVTLLLIGATSCGDDSTETAATTSTTSSEPATTPEEPAGTSASSDTTATTGEPAEAACTEEAILPVVRAAFDQPASPVTVASVTIADCRNGYARVWAIAAQDGMQNEQVFLRDIDGTWTVISSGTGIECSDPANLNETDRTACDALGLTP